ncbi:MAG: adenosylmethionine decarboxylase [Deferribacteraceae bacterium]|nr:adenosylmethionine decarboxylase [Deferribacteraceae bacterium]
MERKIELFGFNNLAKSLNLNIYDVCYTSSEPDRQAYLAYINKMFNSKRLMKTLIEISELIKATVLNISKHDYNPFGASATVLLSEEPVNSIPEGRTVCRENEVILAHLDKSHLAAHTYPDINPDNPVATCRLDIDIVTCGKITPLNALDYLIDRFDPDIITLDYKVRGFTRTSDAKKLYIDHNITSIRDYIDDKTLLKYVARDINIHESNIFHTKMIKNETKMNNQSLRREMIEIFNCSR